MYILVRMLRTKVPVLDGLECGVLPITPPSKTFNVVSGTGEKVTVARQQFHHSCIRVRRLPLPSTNY